MHFQESLVYITQQYSRLSKEGESILIKDENKKIAQLPALNINQILCFGRVTVTPSLMAFCAERGIGITYFSIFGKFVASVIGKQTGNVLLRRTQYRWADDDKLSMNIARYMIASKVANTRNILLRELRNHGENSHVQLIIDKLGDQLLKIKHASNLQMLLGLEGEAAALYFGVFNSLIHNDKFKFENRTRRPPMDPVNALMSFIYALITNECVSALQGVGLDPYVGFLHQDRSGRVSLALDLLEEFRAFWGDRLVLTLINLKQIDLNDFICEASGAYRMTDKGKKLILTAYQERKNTEIMHPYLKEKIPLGLLPHCQALLLSRHLRGDMECYPPFLVK